MPKLNPTNSFSIVTEQVAEKLDDALKIFIVQYAAHVQTGLDREKFKPFFKSEGASLGDAASAAVEMVSGFGVSALPGLTNAIRTTLGKPQAKVNLAVQMMLDKNLTTSIHMAGFELATKFTVLIMSQTQDADKLARIFAQRTLKNYDFSKTGIDSDRLIEAALHENHGLQRFPGFFPDRQRWCPPTSLNGMLRDRVRVVAKPTNEVYVRLPAGCFNGSKNAVAVAKQRNAIEQVTREAMNVSADSPWTKLGANNAANDNNEEITLVELSDIEGIILVGPSDIKAYQEEVDNSEKNFKQWLNSSATEKTQIVFQGQLDGVNLTERRYEGMIVMGAELKNCTIGDRLIGLNSTFQNTTFQHQQDDEQKSESQQRLFEESVWHFEGCEFEDCSFKDCLVREDKQFVNCQSDQPTAMAIDNRSGNKLMQELLLSAQEQIRSTTKKACEVTLPASKSFLSELKYRPKESNGKLEHSVDWEVSNEPKSWVVFGDKEQTIEQTLAYAALQLSSDSYEYAIQLNAQNFSFLISDIVMIAQKFGMELGRSPQEDVLETFFSQLRNLKVNIVFVLFNLKADDNDELVNAFLQHIHKKFLCVIGSPRKEAHQLNDYWEELSPLLSQQATETSQETDAKSSTPLNNVTAIYALLDCEIIPDSLKSQEQKEDDDFIIEDYTQLRNEFIQEGKGKILLTAISTLLEKFLTTDVFATNSTAHEVMAKNAAILPTLVIFLENVSRLLDTQSTRNLLETMTGQQLLEIRQQLAMLHTRVSHNTMQRGWFADAQAHINKAMMWWKGAEPTKNSSWEVQSWRVKTTRYSARLPWLAGEVNLNSANKEMQDAITAWLLLVPNSKDEEKEHDLHVCIFYQDLVGILLQQATTADTEVLRTDYLNQAEGILGNEIGSRLENFNIFGKYKHYTNLARLAWLRANDAEVPAPLISAAQQHFSKAQNCKVEADGPKGKGKRDTLGLYRLCGQFYMEQAVNKQSELQTQKSYLIQQAIESYEKAHANACAFVGGERHPIRFEVTFALAEASFLQIEAYLAAEVNAAPIVRMLFDLQKQVETLMGECDEMLNPSKREVDAAKSQQRTLKLSTDMENRFEIFNQKFKEHSSVIKNPLSQAMQEIRSGGDNDEKPAEPDGEERPSSFTMSP